MCAFISARLFWSLFLLFRDYEALIDDLLEENPSFRTEPRFGNMVSSCKALSFY
jgi:hypothetical protein